ncbi:MAG: DUF4395 domain-containing protein [Deltaproteobacteria bacterium]|nr:DUF4395 domain-containing protein [Deltaproteobacteria bacterium]
MKTQRIPDTVEEPSVRAVALLTALSGVVVLSTGWFWLLPVLTLDFGLRVVLGPRFSPLASLGGRWVAPYVQWESRRIPFSPKRFAAGIGFAMLVAASLLWLVGGPLLSVAGLTGLLVVFALLEAATGFCAGCAVYNQLVRVGLLKHPECPDCRVSVEKG